MQALNKYKPKHFIDLNFRKIPAIVLAKELISSREIGEIYSFRARWFSDVILDKELLLDWRMKKDKAGGGANFDINSHLIDLALFLNDEISELVSIEKTFIKQRLLKGQNVFKNVDVDDAVYCLVNFENGSTGTLEASRVDAGKKESVSFEISGTKCAILYEYQKFYELKVYSKINNLVNGFKTINVTNKNFPYMSNWWTECEECIQKCPYNLEIPTLLKENISFWKDYKNRFTINNKRSMP